MIEGPQRKKLHRREVVGGWRFVTFCCHQRLPLMHEARVASAFAAVMSDTFARHDVKLHAWVVMPEHVHLFVTQGEIALSEALAAIKVRLARRVLTRWKQEQASVLHKLRDENGNYRFWQRGGGFDRNTRDEYELRRTICYIHRNPVERGLVWKPEDWRWSSVRWWMGLREGEVVCDEIGIDLRNWNGFK
jgi:putative transposase